MEWLTFVQIVVLIFIFAFARTFMKCMHDTHCKACKRPQ
jgi:hypothetical protein